MQFVNAWVTAYQINRVKSDVINNFNVVHKRRFQLSYFRRGRKRHDSKHVGQIRRQLELDFFWLKADVDVVDEPLDVDVVLK